MNIKTFLKKEWFLLLALLPLVITFLLLQIWLPLWNDTTKDILFYSIFSYDIALILLWIYHNHSSLFEKDEWIRNTITIVGCGVILLQAQDYFSFGYFTPFFMYFIWHYPSKNHKAYSYFYSIFHLYNYTNHSSFVGKVF